VTRTGTQASLAFKRCALRAKKSKVCVRYCGDTSDEEYFTVRGTVEGYIGFEPKGDNGFGYDPLFFIPEYNMTAAQMKPSKKHEISHRGKAMRMMLEELKKRLDL